MQKGTGLNLGLRYVPESTAQGIRRLPEHQQAQIQEIRLRVQQLPRIYDGRTEQPLPGCEPLRQAQLQACLKTACADSLYSFQRELSQGFVTVEGGNRIGFCGNGVIRDGEVETIRYVSSLNIRIAKQVLLQLGAELGNSDIDGQLAAIGLAEERIHMLLESARQQSREKGKLCTAMGTLLGTLAAILLA